MLVAIEAYSCLRATSTISISKQFVNGGLPSILYAGRYNYTNVLNRKSFIFIILILNCLMFSNGAFFNMKKTR